jgi:uncharacterized membrane protein
MLGRLFVFATGLFFAFAANEQVDDAVPLLDHPFAVQRIPGWIWEISIKFKVTDYEDVYMSPFRFYIGHYAVGVIASCILFAFALRPMKGPRSLLGTAAIIVVALALAAFGIGYSVYWAYHDSATGPLLGHLALYVPFALVGVISLVNAFLRWQLTDSLRVMGLAVLACAFFYLGTIRHEAGYGKVQLAIGAILLVLAILGTLAGLGRTETGQSSTRASHDKD